jgi:hypothetical protein
MQQLLHQRCAFTVVHGLQLMQRRAFCQQQHGALAQAQAALARGELRLCLGGAL